MRNEEILKSLKTKLIHEIGKAVPLQTWSGPEGSRNLRYPDFMTKDTGWW
jgi:hypothetical protein